MSNKLKFLIIIFLAIFFLCSSAEAVDLIPYAEDGQSLGSEGLAYYLGQILKFGIVISAILAVVMIVIAGFQFITAGGNPSVITNARSRIQNALLGLLIVIGSWLILYTINPDLVNVGLGLTPIEFKVKKADPQKITTYQTEQPDANACIEYCKPNGYVFNTPTKKCVCQGTLSEEQETEFKKCWCNAKDCYVSGDDCPLFFGMKNCFERNVPKSQVCI